MIDFEAISKSLETSSPDFKSGAGNRSVVYNVPKLVKKIGLKELEKAQQQAKRHGIDAEVFPKRRLSPSFLSNFYKKALGGRVANFDDNGDYIPNPTDDPRAVIEYWLNERDPDGKKSDALILGQLTEDMICLGLRQTKLNWFPYSGTYSKKIKDLEEETKAVAVKQSLFDRALAMTTEARRDPFFKLGNIRKLTTQRRVEGSIMVGDIEVPLVCVPDFEVPEMDRNADLKTAATISDFADKVWGRGRDSFHYWIQAVVGCHLCGVAEFDFKVIQSKKPYFSDTLTINADEIEKLKEKMIRDVLVPFLYYCENGFKAKYIRPNRWFYDN